MATLDGLSVQGRYLHKGATGQFDFDALADWDIDEDLIEWGFEPGDFELHESQQKDNNDDPKEGFDYVFSTPDAIFPSDNEWDVPTLDIAWQPNMLELPVTKWGDASRKAKMPGTYHFYTEDYKFKALWDDPSDLVNSGCATIFEPNFSTNEQMPMAVGLWGIYRKRWIARYVQTYGIKVWVDLCVSPKFADLNLLGVPEGWDAYVTRGKSMERDLLENDYEIAAQHCGEDPLFCVYGGGKDIGSLCKEQGWLWIPENMHVKEGRDERILHG